MIKLPGTKTTRNTRRSAARGPDVVKRASGAEPSKATEVNLHMLVSKGTNINEQVMRLASAWEIEVYGS